MKEMENIKRLLFSEDSRDLGVELAKSLGLVEKVAKSLSNEVKNLLRSFLLEPVKSWRLVIDSKSRTFIGDKTIDAYNYQIEYRLTDDCNTYDIVGTQGTLQFVKKRADIIKLLKEHCEN